MAKPLSQPPTCPHWPSLIPPLRLRLGMRYDDRSSSSAYTTFGFDCATANAILPTTCLASGSPWLTRRFHVTPPSREAHSPLPGPPLCKCHVFTSNCHIPAKSVLGSPGSMAKSEHPVFGSTNGTRPHASPPSRLTCTR